MTFYFSFCPPSALPSDHKKTLPDFAAVQPPTSNLRPILYSGANQICIGLAPGRTSKVGQGQSQEKFFMVGRSVGRRGGGMAKGGVGGRTADGGWTKVFTLL